MGGENSSYSTQAMAESAFVWPDIFYGMLVSPRRTLRTLSDRLQYVPDLKAILSAVLTVALALVISGLSKVDLHSVPLSTITFIGYFINGFFMWLFWGVILFAIAQFVPDARRNFASLMIITGWSFLPLLFMAPISCFRGVPIVFHLLEGIRALWSALLMWLAFQSALKLGNTKMIVLTLVLPPLLIGFATFWLSWFFISLFIALCSLAMHAFAGMS